MTPAEDTWVIVHFRFCWCRLSRTAQCGCTGSLIETDSSVAFDKKEPGSVWVWIQIGYTCSWISSSFLSCLSLAVLNSERGWRLVRCLWGDDEEGRRCKNGCVIWVKRWMYLGNLNPHLHTLTISPRRTTNDAFVLAHSQRERLLISQWEIHIHTYLGPGLSRFRDESYALLAYL